MIQPLVSADVNPVLAAPCTLGPACHPPVSTWFVPAPCCSELRRGRGGGTRRGLLEDGGVILGHRWRRSSEAGEHGERSRRPHGTVGKYLSSVDGEVKWELFSPRRLTSHNISHFSLLLVLEGSVKEHFSWALCATGHT